MAIALAVIAILVAALHRASRPTPPRLRTAAALRLGTIVRLTVAAPDAARAEADIAAAFDRLATLEATLSAQREDSELNAINRAAGDGPVTVSGDLFAAIRAGVDWFRRTGGCFDIAVGPLIALWQSCGQEGRLPTSGEVASAKAACGAGRIEMDEGARTVRLPDSQMRLHLGGIGKGFCADAIADLLRRRGVQSGLVAMAGDIYAIGRRPDGRPWRVGVQDPRAPDDPSRCVTVLELVDRAVSTSGNYQRFVEIGGRRFSHIVDPRTGWPCDSVPSVTVIGPDATSTDVLGTALSVMGLEEGLRFAEQLPDIEALFITFNANGGLVLHRTSGFQRYEAEDGVNAASDRRDW